MKKKNEMIIVKEDFDKIIEALEYCMEHSKPGLIIQSEVIGPVLKMINDNYSHSLRDQ